MRFLKYFTKIFPNRRQMQNEAREYEVSDNTSDAIIDDEISTYESGEGKLPAQEAQEEARGKDTNTVKRKDQNYGGYDDDDVTYYGGYKDGGSKGISLQFFT